MTRPFLSSKPARRALFAFLIAAAAALIAIKDPTGHLTKLEHRTVDERNMYFGEDIPASDELKIVTITDECLQAFEPVFGRWPWPRSLHGMVTDYLFRDGAKGVIFVFLFPERQLRCELDIDVFNELHRLAENAGHNDSRARLLELLDERTPGAEDAFFANCVATDSGRVVLECALNWEYEGDPWSDSMNPKRDSELRAFVDANALPYPARSPITQFVFRTLPNRELLMASSGVSTIVLAYDSNGIVSRYYPLYGISGCSGASLSMPLLAAAMAKKIDRLDEIKIAERSISIRDVEIPVNRDGSCFVSMQQSPDYIRYSSVLASYLANEDGETPTLEPGLFRDKVVIVGGDFAGSPTLQTPRGSHVAMGFTAQAAQNILCNRFVVDSPVETTWLFCVVASLAVALVMIRFRPLVGFGFSALLIAALSAFSWTAFSFMRILPLVQPVAAAALSMIGILLYRYMSEERDKIMVRSAFGRYLSASVIEEVLSRPEGLKLGGQRKRMSVLFSDIEGFSMISEKMAPERVVEILNEYLNAMVDCVLEAGGLLDKFIGDAVVAEWNAPGDQPDHAARACGCALAMMRHLSTLQAKWKSEGKPVLQVRIGINTGDMIVGNMGSDKIFDYTVVGDEVNIGARLEPLNKEFGTRILVSENTVAEAEGAAPGRFLFRRIARVAVKGREKAVSVHELSGLRAETSAGLLRQFELFDEGLRSYERGDFDAARAVFEKSLALGADATAAIYLRWCDELIRARPAAWDGIFRQEKKESHGAPRLS